MIRGAGSSLLLTVSILAALVAPPVALARQVPGVEEAAPPTKRAMASEAVQAAEGDLAIRPVRVGLGRSQTTVTLSAEGAFTVVIGEQTVLSAQPAQLVTLKLSGGRIQVDGLPAIYAEPVRIVPVPPQVGASNHMRYKQRRYRGELEVMVNSRDGKLSVVNVLGVEEYLIGVVPHEMTPTWHAEAVMAQAVASRTYLLYQMLTGGKYKNEGFDVTDDVNSQVYGGVGSEHPRSSMAVGATAGQVVTHNGQMINAFYHSTSGGFTENNENVWSGSPLPYLRAVADPDYHQENHRYQWTVTKTLAQVAQGMKTELGMDPGALIDFQAGPPGASGRPAIFTAIGSRGTFQLRPEEVRSAIGSLSHVKEVVRAVTRTALQIFGINAEGRPMPLPLSVAVQSAAGVATRSLVGAIATGAGGTPVALQTEQEVAADGTLHFNGGGWGHRVGMSQWGARVLAEQGKTHIEILTHYYTGTKVETL